MNNRFARKNAMNGTGIYDFKDAIPVTESEAMKMTFMRDLERGGYTIFHGLIDGEHVFIADKSDSKIIKALKKKKKGLSDTHEVTRPEIKTSSTYDRWKKRNDANFAAWFGSSRRLK